MPTFDTPEPVIATIDVAAGHVTLRASDRADTVVEVTPTDPSDDADVRAAQQTSVTCIRGKLAVTGAKKRKLTLFGRGPGVDVVVDLPSGSTISVESWGEVTSSGRLGDTRVQSAMSPLRLEEIGPAHLRTAAGHITVTGVHGDADVSTASGDVRIGMVDGSASVKTSHGDLTQLAADAAGSSGDVQPHGRATAHPDPSDRPGPSDETVEIKGRTGFGDVVIRRAATA